MSSKDFKNSFEFFTKEKEQDFIDFLFSVQIFESDFQILRKVSLMLER